MYLRWHRELRRALTVKHSTIDRGEQGGGRIARGVNVSVVRLPMLSNPNLVVDVIRNAAKAVQELRAAA